MDDYKDFVPNVHFELIPIKNLVSNQEYQRGLSEKHIQRTAENFDLYQINPVKVSRREGVNFVFNGQHTIEIVASVSGSRETPVWCMVYDDMDYMTEADVFANQQKYVKNLLPYEIFIANIEAGNHEQLMIKTLVESYGLNISSSGNGPNSICAISSLEYINSKYGYHVLDRTLRLIVATWEGEEWSLSANMLKGVAKLVDTFGEKLRDDVFKEKVGLYSAKEISRTAKERKGGTMGYSEAMLIAYNRKMKRGLPWAELYSKKRKTSSEPMSEEEFEETPDLFEIEEEST